MRDVPEGHYLAVCEQKQKLSMTVTLVFVKL